MRLVRGLSNVLIFAGLLLLLDVGATLAWQEPVSALYSKLRQDQLSDDLATLERQGPTTAELQALQRIRLSDERLAFLARSLRRRSERGDAIGRVRIPGIGLNSVMVEGTDTGDLREGPGHYANTPLPGLRGTVAVAGHRTTYGAPFRNIDRVERGDRILVEMPYARFVYSFERRQIVRPDALEVIRRVRYDRLVLSACHPKYSAAKRIIVFARLTRAEPLDARLSSRGSGERFLASAPIREPERGTEAA
jgi:sortase A